MTPDWAFQALWFGAGIGGTGALWYFLSQRDYHTALWVGFATIVVVCFTIALHIRNDLLRRQAIAPALASIPAQVTPESPEPSLARPASAEQPKPEKPAPRSPAEEPAPAPRDPATSGVGEAL